MRTFSVRFCDCGRPLGRNNHTGKCLRCGRRKQRSTAALTSNIADTLTSAIRAARVPVYRERAAQRVPLFDPPIEV